MMRRCALVAMVAIPCAAFAQNCSPVLAGGTQLESARFLVGFRTEPQAISVGRHFTVEVAVCPKPGVPAPVSVGVDAHMPEHRHGMNYKAQVTAASGGHYRAAGLMFHMPGRWEFIFDVRTGDKSDHLSSSTVIR
jgi:hypothetical protein